MEGSVLNVLDPQRPPAQGVWRRLPDPWEPHLLRATFRQSFTRHSHDRFAVGVIEAGGLAFRYRNQDVHAPQGWVNLAFPGEVHDGHPTSAEGWSYRMFYLDPGHLLEVARSLDPDCHELPFISPGAVDRPDLAVRVSRVHRLSEDPESDPMARESALGALLQDLLQAYPGLRLEHPTPHRGLLRVRDLLEACFDQPLQLEGLAKVAGTNRFALVRAFTGHWGLPPHAYLVQVRLRRAAALLRRGCPPTQAALEVGFADQSHLNRHFKKAFGTAPGAYARAFRHPQG